MTVNANVRCVEWFDASNSTPTDPRFVIGWFPQHYGGMCIVTRFGGEQWTFGEKSPGLPIDAAPSHWCEFPDGPGNPKDEPEYQAQLKWARDVVSNVVIPPADDKERREEERAIAAEAYWKEKQGDEYGSW